MLALNKLAYQKGIEFLCSIFKNAAGHIKCQPGPCRRDACNKQGGRWARAGRNSDETKSKANREKFTDKKFMKQ